MAFLLTHHTVSVLVANSASVKRTSAKSTLVIDAEGWSGLAAVSGPLQLPWCSVNVQVLNEQKLVPANEGLCRLKSRCVEQTMKCQR